MNFFNDLNLGKKDAYFLVFLLAVNLVITYRMIVYNMQFPIYCSDMIVYIVNAMNFANANPGLLSNYSMFLSPVICFIGSLLIRMSVSPELALFIVTGAFGILGNVGLYVLLRNRFSPLLSLLGAILYGSFSIVLFWWVNGVDISAVAISIWILVFTIMAVDKNPKYYLVAVPLFAIGFFSRYTVGFMLPLMLLYFLSKHDIIRGFDNLISDRVELKKSLVTFFKSREFIYIIVSMVIAAVISLVLIKVIYSYTGQLMFLTQAKESAGGFSSHTKDFAYEPNYLYYVKNFLTFLFCEKIFYPVRIREYSNPSIFSYIVCLIMALGIIIKFKDKLDSLKNFVTESFKTPFFTKISLVVILALLAVSFLLFKKSFLFVDVPLLIIATILLSLHKGDDKFRLSVMVVMWFLIYFVFFTLDSIKTDRYIITVLPAFVYFFIYAVDAICQRFTRTGIVKAIPVILIVFCLIWSFNFTDTVDDPKFAIELEDALDFLVEHDPDYQDKEIISCLNRYATWYLHKNIDLMNSSTLNAHDIENASYIVLYNYVVDKNNDTLNDTGFEVIYRNSEYTVFGKEAD